MTRPASDLQPISAGDAAARLRYVAGVRTRTRRAVLLPSLGLLTAAGVVIGTHGLLVALWPLGSSATLAWLAAVLAARPVLLRRWRAAGPAPWVSGSARLWISCVVAGGLGVVAAGGVGVDQLVTGIAAASAMRAHLAGMTAVAVGAVLTGLAVDALMLQGVPRSTCELVLGAAMVAAGLSVRSGDPQ